MFRALAKATLFACLAASAAAGEGRLASGAALWEAGADPDEGAFLVVEARDLSGALFAATRRRAAGLAPPVPFSIPAPEAGATLRLSIVGPEGARWASAEIAAPPGAEPAALGEVALLPLERMEFASRMRCGEEIVAVGVAGPDLMLEARGLRRRLSAVPAASGARFDAPGDPTTYFWSKGEAALVSLGGVELPECRVDPPPRPAPDFRAGGNEPGWSFEIAGGRAVLTLDYGAERREAPLPPPAPTAEGAVIVSAALDATLRIERRLCRDDATGMPHPVAASVETGGRTLAGCGGRPLDLLLGGEWRIEDIGGAGVIDLAEATVGFGPDGRAGGSGSCNRWSAEYALTGEGLAFGRVIATRRACPPAVMDQERKLLDALARVARFDIDGTGALLLLDEADAVLLAGRR